MQIARTKIVGTIGPSSSRPEVLRSLIASGLDVARINFSHGTHEEHSRTIATLRGLALDAGKPVAILGDYRIMLVGEFLDLVHILADWDPLYRRLGVFVVNPVSVG